VPDCMLGPSFSFFNVFHKLVCWHIRKVSQSQAAHGLEQHMLLHCQHTENTRYRCFLLLVPCSHSGLLSALSMFLHPIWQG
jgi:hypothetical protein